MQIYLPIAEVSINAFLLLGLGGMVGFLSGMFGVGGGFLITPLLLFVGVPPGVAVATGANQVVASSISGMLVQMKRKGVDFRMGLVLLVGGFAGSFIGVQVFAWMTALGQIDLFVQLQLCAVSGADRRADVCRKRARAAAVASRRSCRRRSDVRISTLGCMGCR